MPKLNRREFEKIVKEGIKAIPEKFLRKLENVAIVIEDEPTPAQKKKLNIHSGWTLFGLYEGVPQIERGAGYSAVLPDKITIFQQPIEALARDEKDIKAIVKNTVWHEIAHHFGMDEARVQQAEAKRHWSADVTKHSFALQLEEDIFTWDNPRKIAKSLKKSAEESLNRKGTAFQSAMSMLNFYINRAGKNLKPERKKILEQAKTELRKLFKK